MNKPKYDSTKTLLENALTLATYYESTGDKERAKKFFTIAEKIEKVLAKNKETITKAQRERGAR